MAGLFARLKKFLTYQEPKQVKPFEFLEGEDEGSNNNSNKQSENQSQRDNSKNNNQQENKDSSVENDKSSENQEEDNHRNQNNNKQKRAPLSLDEWSKMRSNEDKLIETESKIRETRKSDLENEFVAFDIAANIEKIHQAFNVSKNQSVIIREFKIARKLKAFIVFIEGTVDGRTINDIILRQLMNPENFCEMGDEYPVDYITNNVISINKVVKEIKLDKILLQTLRGSIALFIDNCTECILMEAMGFQKRSVEQPVTEIVVKGSQEAFTENLETNISIIRRLIKNKDLIDEVFTIGKTDNSKCAMLYLDNIANERMVSEVRRRLKSINTEFITGAGIIEQLIEDNPYMIFPQMLSTERPDRTVSFIMEGKVAILIDGTPFINVVPITFFHLLHTSEDYLLRWQYGTFLRIIRTIAFFISIYLPGTYVALTLFHQEMIPTELLASIAQARETVPFPTVVELLFMEVSFELIREASIRVPAVVGQTLGIIGALILGQAAVQAGLVSPVLIIVVAITGLGNFSIPNYSLALAMRITRFFFIALGALAGLYGLVLGTFLIGCIACSVKSFGVPFFTTVAPKTKGSHDVVIRAPVWKLKERPDMLNTHIIQSEKKEPRGWVNKETGDGNSD